jgi:predicted nucleic acid-binding protein
MSPYERKGDIEQERTETTQSAQRRYRRTYDWAAGGVRDYQMSYFDAQIWATARLSQVRVIFSEDFNTGAILEGIKFVRPFEPDFDSSAWI